MQRDRSRTPPARTLGNGPQTLDQEAQEAPTLIGVQRELETLRLVVQELWRQLRVLEAEFHGYTFEAAATEHIATTALWRWATDEAVPLAI